MSLRDRFLLALALVVMGVGFRWATKAWKEEIRGERERAVAPAEPPPSSQVRVEDIPKEDASVLLRSPAPPTASPRAPKSGARIHGRVTVAGSEAPLPEGSRIDVRERAGEWTREGYLSRVLQRVPLDPTGRYEVRLGADAVPATRELTVVAAIPGRAYVRHAIRISPGDDMQVDLVSGAVGREGTLQGHVHDEAGRPVPGLRLRIQRSLASEAELDLETRLADPESDAPEGYTSASEGIVTTGPDGRFALTGLSGTQYGVASLDDDWLVWYASSATATGLRVDSGEGALVAARAFVLEVRVTDAETGELLEPIRINETIRLNGELGGSNNAVGNVNPTRWQARIPPGGELGFDVVVDAGASGYRSARRTVRFEPGRWIQRLEVALTRPRYERGELGRLRLLHALLDETGRPAPLAVTLWEVVEDGERIGRKAQVTRGDDGFETLELPAGPATEVQLGVRRGGPVRWRGKVDVVGGGTMDFRVPFPPAGALRVHMAGTEGRRLALIGPEGQRTSTSHKVPVDRKTQTVFLPGVPVGRWRIQVDGAGEEAAVTVEVEEGRVTEAFLPK